MDNTDNKENKDNQEESDTQDTNTPVSHAETELSRESQQWGMFAHLSALIGFVIPFGNLLGPFLIWQIKKDDPFVVANGKEALNFQITAVGAGIICWILMFVLIGFLLLPVLVIGVLGLMIYAGVRANDGEAYEYPFAIRLIQ